jgi:hypothetical protein
VSRVLKVAVWAAVFLGSAGVGAYIAAHTDLFPPDVEGALLTSPSGSPSVGSPSVDDPTWTGLIHSSTYHELYVGGRCTTRWMTRLSFDLLDGGRIVGTGTARLEEEAVCTFPNAQVNAEEFDVIVGGRWDVKGLGIRLEAGDRTPAGTTDYGGFEFTVFAGGPGAEITVPFDTRRLASGTVRMEREDDQGRGTYVSLNRVSLEEEA